MRLDVAFAGHVQPWLKDFLARNPTGAARFVADFAAEVARYRAESSNETDFVDAVETLCAIAAVKFNRGVAMSVYNGYIGPGEYAMGLKKDYQD